ncbi:hypothetical protein TVAG_237980 [Trichomonas vaginalis G3]|uniref:DUF4200 domain-containing protein n=1 Tax=Trichomonas vaginalis (strain ATCC PRA-98 / G3) TaxID=412133 RepID=A2DCZ8_TRIV3|nr:cilia- and flagella-associated protein 100 family [Trichomonas vaginalis G3]EAY21772.1 hypothetical protein TVAG_237980 [Trichomonas vaginalis G3]KAI5524256.1 cilia- and flagella-associated protein 100 family [Trichomonas vaginalis G3]|eukprot:XP_001582758.1 hypothetical protein [Trichomonas vaginalis G3]
MKSTVKSSRLPRPAYLDAPIPFDLPPDEDLFARREEENQKMKEYMKELSKKTLVQRSSMSKSPLYSAGISVSKSKRTVSESQNDFKITPPVAEHQRKEQMHDFVEQKREIFLAQLLIDRKMKEIERISQARKTEKKNIDEEESKIAETSNQYKMSRNQIDAELTRGKKSMEDAIKKRTEIFKELKKKDANVTVIQSEISKNQEILESYHNYYNFLKNLCPPTADPITYFTDPQQVINELTKVEMDNLFLIQHCHELSEEAENGLQQLNSEITKTVNEKKSIEKSTENLREVEQFQAPAVSNNNPVLDKNVKELTESVKKCYVTCFGVHADINPLTMLERIENQLEAMYNKCGTIDQKFLTEQMLLREKKRREEQRIEANKKKQEDIARKAAAALERAKKPIKKRTGRPLNERTLPIKARRTVDEKQKQEEEKAVDDFLFGEIYY